MGAKYSKQLTSVANKAAYTGYDLLLPTDRFGRVRVDWFEFRPAVEGAVGGALATGDTIDLAWLPPLARILGVFITNEDLGTDVALNIGLKGTDQSGSFDKAGSADDPDFLAANLDLTSARTIPTNVNTLNIGYLTKKNVTVYGTIVNAGSISIDTSKNFSGYVQYVVD